MMPTIDPKWPRFSHLRHPFISCAFIFAVSAHPFGGGFGYPRTRPSLSCDLHLHKFTIRGQWYGIPRIGGLHFHSGPPELTLTEFGFRLRERFTYEYDFHSHWLHDIRLETILSGSAHMKAPWCVAGCGTSPPEDSGPPERFMRHLDEHSPMDLIERLMNELDDTGCSSDQLVELSHEWLPWLQGFDRQRVNQRLSDPAYSE